MGIASQGIIWGAMALGGLWGLGFFGPLDPELKIPSLSPYADADLANTLSFTKRPGKPWIKARPIGLKVTAYTDAPGVWTALRFRGAVELARWYLARCQIRLPQVKLRRLPKGYLTPKGLVKWRIHRPLQRTKHPYETFLFFTKDVSYYWGIPKKKYNLLGVSADVWLKQSKQLWRKYPAVWTRHSPIYTTFIHELGHRLGLPHTRKPYHLMLTGAGVRSSFWNLWTSLWGFFAPRRFLFTPGQCWTMYRTLQQEQKPPKKPRIFRLYPVRRPVIVAPPKRR